MTTRNFNAKVGITTGNITLTAATGNANVANVNVANIANVGNLLVGRVASNLIPNSNGVLSLANSTSRYKDFSFLVTLILTGRLLLPIRIL